MADRFYIALAKVIYWILGCFSLIDDKTVLGKMINHVVGTLKIKTDTFMGRVLFQNKIKLNFEDKEKQAAIDSYRKCPLHGDLKFIRKGIDEMITLCLNVERFGLPYEIYVLDTVNNWTYGARVAAGSPRVYVDYTDGEKSEIIRVSIDENDPRILDGDEKYCQGADFTEIYEFNKKCYIPLIKQWEGKYISYQLYESVTLIMEGHDEYVWRYRYLNFRVLSRNDIDAIYRMDLDRGCAIISITEPGSQDVPFKNDERINEVLRLQFSDVSDINEPNAMSEEDARRIVDFVLKWKDEVENIVIHCESDKSRNAGICAALLIWFEKDDRFIRGGEYYQPNPLCASLVLQEFGRRDLS